MHCANSAEDGIGVLDIVSGSMDAEINKWIKDLGMGTDRLKYMPQVLGAAEIVASCTYMHGWG